MPFLLAESEGMRREGVPAHLDARSGPQPTVIPDQVDGP